MFAIQTLEDRRATLKIILFDASILVTSALVVADEAQAAPVADDPYFLRLLSQRMSSSKYVGSSSPHAWLLGMEFARSVIPDEALQKLSVAEVVEYRRKSQDVFQAWTGELNQIAAKIDDISILEATETIPKLIITELRPRIAAYKSEMAATRDALFGDLVKGISNWKVPGLSFGSMATMGFGAAVTAFAALTAGTVATSMVDFYKARRAAVRRHAVSYLIGLEDP
jgi:hypothetical protein